MSKKTSLIVGIIVVALAGLVIYSGVNPGSSSAPSDTSLSNQTNSQTSASKESVNPNQSQNSTNSASNSSSYTMADVAKHNSGSSCWTAINGGVYDVTAWINQHPGGSEAILSLCGKDGSSAFNGQHGGQRRPASELATFKIGTLN